jgi:hypothetical protein
MAAPRPGDRHPRGGTPPARPLSASGRVIDPDGAPVVGILVRAFDRDLRREAVLGETVTGADGTYRIAYDASRLLDPSRPGPHLVVRVFGEGMTLRAASPVVFRAEPDQRVDVRLERTAPAAETEYGALGRRLRAAGVAGDGTELSEEDLEFLRGASGIARDALERFRSCARLSRETGIPGAALYALATQGLSLSLPELLAEDPERLETALRRADAAGVIGGAEADASAVIAGLESAAIAGGLLSRREATLVLRDRASGRPLVGYRLRAIDLDARPTPRVIARVSTDSRGRATVRRPGRQGAPGGLLRLEITDPAGAILGTQEVQVPTTDEPVAVDVRLPSPPSLASRSLTEIAQSAQISLPADPDTTRADPIRTLAELRRRGGFRTAPGAEPSVPTSTRHLLEAHASLETLGEDVRANGALIERGYVDAPTIARAGRRAFLAQAEAAGLSIDQARRMHERARLQVHVADVGAAPSRAYAKEAGDAAKAGKPPEPEGSGACDCADCDTAVSPRAYLVDLLAYTLNHLQRDGQPLTVSALSTLLCVPLGDLVDSCEASEASVRQVRLCIEVLRQAVGTPAHAVVQNYLSAAEARYRAEAYRTLLAAIGTSHEELRRARGLATEARTALAERLGFLLSSGGVDRLDTLLGTGDPTEAQLADLFGLAPTVPSAAGAGTVPQLLQWRREFLRTLWTREDAPSSTVPPGTPIIDPDLLGPDDFRTLATTAGAPFARWTSRRQQVDAGLTALRNRAPDANAMLQHAFGSAPPNLVTLGQPLDTATTPSATVAATQAILAATGLDVDAFRRLAALHGAATANPLVVTTGEWDELASILAQSMKVRQWLPAWLTEEQQDGLILGPQDFWPPAHEPPTGPWPPPGVPQRILVDPDLVGSEDLRGVMVAGQPAVSLWHQRAAALGALATELATRRDAGNVPAMVKRALGLADTETAIAQDLQSLHATLSVNPDPASPAGQRLTTIYRLTIPELDLLIRVKTAAEATSSLTPRPTAADWDALVAALRRAHKDAQGWKTAEGPLAYWEVLRHALPPWRANAAARQRWSAALNSESARPVIDPDLVTEEDLEAPLSSNAALPLLLARRGLLGSLEAAIAAARPAAASESAWLDQQLQDLGLSPAEVATLDAAQGSGQAIQARLRQIGCPPGTFARLGELRRLLAAGPATAAELEEAVNILVAVHRGRRHAHWRGEEGAAGITLGPDFFRSRSDDVPVLLVPWRAAASDRRAWERTLRGRIQQEAALKLALRAAVAEAEEAALPALRDVLVWAAYIPAFLAAQPTLSPEQEPPDRRAELHARWVTQRYQIDAQSGACQETTRTGQAIDTLLGLLWSVRTALVGDVLPGLTLDAEDFDADWRWMGSYATWRAAMFAFIYPENILLPALRRRQSPVFAAIVGQLRLAGRTTGAEAATALRQYSDYLRDVHELQVQATASLDTVEAFTGRPHGVQCVLFGLAPASGHVYYAVKQPHEPAGFWAPVPGLGVARVTRIVGAAIHQNPAEASVRQVVLLLEGRQDGRACVVAQTLRVSLDAVALTWVDGDAAILDVDRADAWQALVVSSDSWTEPPCVLLWGAEGCELRYLDPSGAAWSSDPARQQGVLHEDHDTPFDLGETTPRAAVWSYDAGLWVVATNPYHFYSYVNRKIEAHQFLWTSSNLMPDSFWARERTLSQDMMTSDWTGSQHIPSQHRLVAFYSTSSQLFSSVLTLDPTAPTLAPWQPFAALEGTGEWTVNAPGMRDRGWLAYERPFSEDTSPGPHEPRADRRLVQVRVTAAGHVATVPIPLLEGPHFRLTPVMPPYSPLPVDLRGSDAQLRTRLGEIAALNPDTSAVGWAYLDEAFYLLPLHLALQLQRSGFFDDALREFRKLYDYGSATQRYTYPPLDPAGAATPAAYSRLADWLADPLDVHAIAAIRPGTAARAVLLALVRCLLDYGDSEFTQDTGEAITRARLLYQEALALLDDPLLRQRLNGCDEVIATLTLGGSGSSVVLAEWQALLVKLSRVKDLDVLRNLVMLLKKVLGANRPWPERRDEAHAMIDAALAGQPKRPRTLLGALDEEADRKSTRHATRLTGKLGDELLTLLASLQGLAPSGTVPSPQETFCIPRNPLLEMLRLRAELNLYKIRTCRNIAGQERTMEPYAAPTDATSGMPQIGVGGQLTLPGALTLRATPYRYRVLAGRARDLAALAQQMEAGLLSALEKRDGALFDLLRARQQAGLTRATIRLHDLRVREAEHGVTLAALQRERASLQADHFDGLINDGLLDEEAWALGLMWVLMCVQFGVAAVKGAAFIAAGIGGDVAKAAADVGLTAGSGTGAAAIGAAATDSTIYQGITGGMASWSSALSMAASFRRREQDWQLQLDLARQDERIGDAGMVLADDRVRIAGQERAIAALEADNADDVVAFLQARFTNPELYDWMSRVLESVYRYFLQQATAVARLAEAQLAFERQEIPPAMVQADYWDPPTDGLPAPTAAAAPADRRGLTGSVRLLQDLTRLDQYAFETDRRKLQLTKTLSLARLDPFGFQRFRETGVMIFATPMSLFDRDFPGHYLRLVRRVRTSVIALIPPSEGLRATLATTGISRVVVGGDVFQTTVVHRPPESVALTSPLNATGLFELESQGHGDMLLPFEGLGVDTAWELRMPRAANPIDYRTIADVLVTIEYTALDSFAYRQMVMRTLDRTVSADRPFSFRQQFADQWYDLSHPELAPAPLGPMRVAFATERRDFAANLTELAIEHVTLYFVRGEGQTFEVPVDALRFTPAGGSQGVGGPVVSLNGLVSTRQGNAGSWMGMLGKSPAGTWELALPDTDEIRARFRQGEIQDILFVITYGGTLPPWPA